MNRSPSSWFKTVLKVNKFLSHFMQLQKPHADLYLPNNKGMMPRKLSWPRRDQMCPSSIDHGPPTWILVLLARGRLTHSSHEFPSAQPLRNDCPKESTTSTSNHAAFGSRSLLLQFDMTLLLVIKSQLNTHTRHLWNANQHYGRVIEVVKLIIVFPSSTN